MRKIVFLFEGNFDVENYPRHFKKGQVEEVPEADAFRLVADKCAAYYVPKPKKVKHDDKNNE